MHCFALILILLGNGGMLHDGQRPARHGEGERGRPTWDDQPSRVPLAAARWAFLTAEKVIEDHAWIGDGVKKTPAFRTTLTQESL